MAAPGDHLKGGWPSQRTQLPCPRMQDGAWTLTLGTLQRGLWGQGFGRKEAKTPVGKEVALGGPVVIGPGRNNHLQFSTLSLSYHHPHLAQGGFGETWGRQKANGGLAAQSQVSKNFRDTSPPPRLTRSQTLRL